MPNPVAETIRRQIGAGALFMLGAWNLISYRDGLGALSFRVKGSRKPFANWVKITLDASDTYTVEFKRLGRAPSFKVFDVADYSDVYVDMLHGLIEKHTGLYTSL
jgi:hypothetical protein